MKKKRYSWDDETLVTLLNLNGEIFPMDNGYWTKFEAFWVSPNQHVPHGVRYSLTLHDRYNRRVLEFDNAHAIKLAKRVMEPGKSPVTTNTGAKRYHLMSMNRQVSYWKIPGAKLHKSWNNNER